MLALDLSRWNQVWLARPWTCRPVPGTSLIELHGVQGFLVPGDIAFLFNLASAVPAAGRYLEVGSWLGLSSIVVANGLLANLNFDAKVYCVDTWRGSAEHQTLPEVQEDLLYDHFLRNVTASQLGALIQPFRGASAEIARAWEGPKLDVVFIDGDHSFAGCSADIRSWSRHLAPGGRLLGHDAAPGSEVRQAVEQYCCENRCTAEIHPLPQAHYIWEIHERGRSSQVSSLTRLTLDESTFHGG